MSNISIKKDFADGDILYSVDLDNNFAVIEEGVNSLEGVLDEKITEASTALREELEDITAERGWDWDDGSAERVTFFKGTGAQVAAKPIKNGQLLYNTETGATALDDNNERIVTGSGNVVEINSGTEPENIATKLWVEKRTDNENFDTLNYRDNSDNTWKTMQLGVSGDTLPIGTIVEYEGSVAPEGYEEIQEEKKEIASFYRTSAFTYSGTAETNIPLQLKESNKTTDSAFELLSDGSIKITKDCDLEVSCSAACGSFSNNTRRFGLKSTTAGWLTQFMFSQTGYITFSASPVYFKATSGSIIWLFGVQDGGQCSVVDAKSQTHVTIREI